MRKLGVLLFIFLANGKIARVPRSENNRKNEERELFGVHQPETAMLADFQGVKCFVCLPKTKFDSLKYCLLQTLISQPNNSVGCKKNVIKYCLNLKHFSDKPQHGGSSIA